MISVPRRRAAICLLLAALAGCGRPGSGDVALGTLERDRFELTAEAREPITEIAVREGDLVTTGQLLLRLDDSAMRARLDHAGAVVKQAKNRLAELVSGPRAEEILAARARLEGAESQVQSEQSEFSRVQTLVAQKLLSPSSLDRQRALRDAALADRKAARATLTELLRGTRIEELDQARAALDGANAQLAELTVSAQRLTVTAPVDGIIEALPYKVGERPPAGNPVVIMLRAGMPYARVYVPEPLRARVRAGTTAEVRVDGVAAPLAGEARYVASEAAFTPYFALNQRDRSRLAFLAEVTLTDPAAAELPAGLPVEVRFMP
jgi:HlyD family secretion protein